MRTFVRLVGIIATALGAFLILAGVSSLPSGGLMFALPYSLFIPGMVLVLVGIVTLMAARGKKADGKSPT